MDGSAATADVFTLNQGAGTTPLEAVRIGWRPLIARDRRPIGMRIEVRAATPQTPTTAAALLTAVVAGLAADEATSFPRGLVVIAPLGVGPDASLARWRGPRNVLLEVGSDTIDASRLPALDALQRSGMPLVLRLAPGHRRPSSLGRFSYVIEGATPANAGARQPLDSSLWVNDIQTRADVEGALARGAAATVGWPLDEPAAEVSAGLEPTRRAVLDIVRLIQSDADVNALELAFKNEPSLSYMLLSFVNSPAMATNAPISSLGHAIMLLGYKKLVRWLVLLLGVSSTGSRALPMIHQAVQRGFFLEALGGRNRATRDDLFAVGAFSLLDKITGQSHERLFASASLPRSVLEAVRAHQGVYGATLALAEIVERGDATATERAAALVHLPLGVVNGALLQSLAAADALQVPLVTNSAAD
jgi:c-di-GMP phosphodiesterase